MLLLLGLAGSIKQPRSEPFLCLFLYVEQRFHQCVYTPRQFEKEGKERCIIEQKSEKTAADYLFRGLNLVL